MSCPSLSVSVVFALRLRMIYAPCVFLCVGFVCQWHRIMNYNHSTNQANRSRSEFLFPCVVISHSRAFGILNFFGCCLSASHPTRAQRSDPEFYLNKRPLRPPGSREPDSLPPACFFRIPLDLAMKNPTWKLQGVPCGHSHTFWKVSPDAAARNLVQLDLILPFSPLLFWTSTWLCVELDLSLM